MDKFYLTLDQSQRWECYYDCDIHGSKLLVTWRQIVRVSVMRMLISAGRQRCAILDSGMNVCQLHTECWVPLWCKWRSDGSLPLSMVLRMSLCWWKTIWMSDSLGAALMNDIMQREHARNWSRELECFLSRWCRLFYLMIVAAFAVSKCLLGWIRCKYFGAMN